jgi:hypothetical protein
VRPTLSHHTRAVNAFAELVARLGIVALFKVYDSIR